MRKKAVLGALLFSGAALAQAPDAQKWEGPFVERVSPQVSPALRDLPVAAPAELECLLQDERRPPRGMAPQLGWNDDDATPDPLASTGLETDGRTPTPSLTFLGQSNTCGCSPPDPIGAAGPNHYVQMVNATKLQVYNKATGATISGPSELRLLWPSGNCRNSTNGDPIVTYDWLANRWLLAQFSTGNGVCVAVSQTNDPTGAYNLYEFSLPDFPDYFKIGAWSNAYYMGSNETNYSAYALDRAAMLAGTAATSIRFTGQTNFLMPATVVGATAPPGGAPGIFYTFKDDSFHGGTDRLEFYHFTPNFVTPASSTFALAQSLNVTAFTYTVCGFFNLSCIPQGGTTRTVDPVSEWPMWQLQYRNFGGGDERLVANFTVDVGSDRAGIRWYEIGRSGATYSITQESTYAPADGRHRWMGSIAMDKCGDIALAYSTSSTSESPSLRIATRLFTDRRNKLQTEAVLVSGGGSQTTSNRWGDYSALTLDPSDECTFWYTGEYYTASSGSGWTTRVGKFVLPNCQQPSCGSPLTASQKKGKQR
jgi:hypothetical protein